MCGIAGCLELDGSPVPPATLEKLAAGLSHRGPDSRGTWADDHGGIGFAHCRLAILDLSPLGHQPMESSTGRYTISFNGEVYNFLEIRNDLEQQGHKFRSHS